MKTGNLVGLRKAALANAARMDAKGNKEAARNYRAAAKRYGDQLHARGKTPAGRASGAPRGPKRATKGAKQLAARAPAAAAIVPRSQRPSAARGTAHRGGGGKGKKGGGGGKSGGRGRRAPTHAWQARGRSSTVVYRDPKNPKHKIIVRTVRTNPINEVTGIAILGVTISAGLILASILDRMIATRTPKDGTHAWYGQDATARILAKPDGMRLLAQAVGTVVGVGGGVMLAKKMPKTAYALAGLGIGFGAYLIWQLWNYFAAPAFFKVEKGDELSFGNRYYALEQSKPQEALSTYNKAQDEMGKTAPGQGTTLPATYTYAQGGFPLPGTIFQLIPTAGQQTTSTTAGAGYGVGQAGAGGTNWPAMREPTAAPRGSTVGCGGGCGGSCSRCQGENGNGGGYQLTEGNRVPFEIPAGTTPVRGRDAQGRETVTFQPVAKPDEERPMRGATHHTVEGAAHSNAASIWGGMGEAA